MVVILTRNAIHGGVESIVEMHARLMDAPVVVVGGLDDPYGTCPFPYSRADTPAELQAALKGADAVIYHWLPYWATDVIGDLKIPAIEYVHRMDTADGDLGVPKITVAHSPHLVAHMDRLGANARLIPYPIEVDEYSPTHGGPRIGGVTSYYRIKGLDTIIRAYKLLSSQSNLLLSFYGSGDDKPRLEQLAAEEGVPAQLLGPALDAKEAWREYRLAISAAVLEGGLPLAILEALACGVPAVVPELPGCMEFSNMAKGAGVTLPLYFFDGTPEGLAAKMSEALAQDFDPREINAGIRKLIPPRSHIKAVRQAILDAKQL